ncbi:MAG: hypothetical protein JWM87_3096 [Candidatus Eremiobacteraeota bacterium]|nr:hypothetical protein [Candidatus Eremiobacteraeota bacterium]
MNTRPATIAAVAAILVVGFAIGGWLALVSRPSGHATTTMATRTIRTPDTARTPSPIATAMEASTPVPTPKAVPTPTPSPVSTSKPVPAAATVAPAARTAPNPAVAVQSVPAGSWELDEANTQVGTILWAADVASTPGNTVVLNAHKQSVGGHPAVPCERQTTLHAEFSAGTAAQSVPFREVNCEGVATTGEMRVTSISGNGASFSGSFWRNGAKLGDFSARRR